MSGRVGVRVPMLDLRIFPEGQMLPVGYKVVFGDDTEVEQVAPPGPPPLLPPLVVEVVAVLLLLGLLQPE